MEGCVCVCFIFHRAQLALAGFCVYVLGRESKICGIFVMLPRKAWLACLTTLRASCLNQGHLHVYASATKEPSDACTSNASHRNQLRQGYISWRLFRNYPWSACSRIFPWKCTIFLSLLPSQRAIIKHFFPLNCLREWSGIVMCSDQASWNASFYKNR